MTNQQGAPEALRLADLLRQQAAYHREVASDCDMRAENTINWGHGEVCCRAADELLRLHAYCQELEAQVILDCMTHGQQSAEIEHVVGDVSKNGAESNMAQQPAPSAAHVVADALADSQYLAGVSAGWNAANADDPNSALQKLHESRAGYLKPLSAPKPSPTPQADSAPAEAVQRIIHLRADRERRVYVAGPMIGLPEYNFPLFNATAARLRSEGWHVENPAEHGHVEGAGWADYLRWDISRLATCGAIYLLPGWSKSKGASLEVHIAQVLDLRVILADGAEQPPSPQPAVTAGAVDALCDSQYAAGMLLGWNLCTAGDEETFRKIRGQRMTSALAAQRATHQGDLP